MNIEVAPAGKVIVVVASKTFAESPAAVNQSS